MKTEHERSVQEVLETALNEYQAAHEAYWSEELPKRDYLGDGHEVPPPSEWYSYCMARREAFRVANSPAAEDFSDSYELLLAVEPDGTYHNVPLHSLEIEFTRRLVEELPGSFSRLTTVVAHALEGIPASPVVRHYLDLLGRSYVAGHDAACRTLCRSLLEVALKDRLGFSNGLFGLIEGAHDRDVLNKAEQLSAHRIRLEGHAAAHAELIEATPVWESISDTLLLVEALSDDEEQARRER
jgi:hypothetical protein